MLARRQEAAATAARRVDAKLLVIGREEVRDVRLPDLVGSLEPGDVLVVNDAATLPASLHGVHRDTNAAIELRLAQALDENDPRAWRGVLFGAGDWRTATEDRAPPPGVGIGDRLRFSATLEAVVTGVDARSARLVDVRFDAPLALFFHELYAHGAPIQYSYHRAALHLYDLQTLFAAKPVALEPPSAAMHFDWSLVFRLKERGVEVRSLTHATGIASSGDEAIDRALPLPERYVIPEATAAAVNRARAAGKRVVAMGTGVVRALESAAGADGVVGGGTSVTTLKLGPEYRRKVVDGLVTGMHEDDSSHLQLLAAFQPAERIRGAYSLARAKGYLWHEFGDVCLIWG